MENKGHFQKGHDPRRCTNSPGRPKKTYNDIRNALTALTDNNWERLEKGLQKMDDEGFTRFYFQHILKHILPPPVEDYMKLSDADFQRLISEVAERTKQLTY